MFGGADMGDVVVVVEEEEGDEEDDEGSGEGRGVEGRVWR